MVVLGQDVEQLARAPHIGLARARLAGCAGRSRGTPLACV
jgi:hypothetical protein